MLVMCGLVELVCPCETKPYGGVTSGVTCRITSLERGSERYYCINVLLAVVAIWQFLLMTHQLRYNSNDALKLSLCVLMANVPIWKWLHPYGTGC